MTKVFNDPAHFVDEALAGFVRAHGDLVQPVRGGVVRATEAPEGKVAVVVGGGSGHYPAFAGWVGPGMADGAVVGNIFASPSTQQVVAVARAASRGGGVLLSYGNYAGDVLNFDLAAQRLADEGIEVVSVPVTDDVTSADVTERAKRRGIAGDFVVFKAAGAAAEAGHDLAGVERLTRRANERTRSFGVAFAGCTLPGEPEALFTVPEGQMGVGLGVHGEPGIDEQPVATARDLARQLVERLLAERPDDADGRVGVVVNGLGGTKYEELFVLFGDVIAALEGAGLRVVAPEVGELITSLDMEGASLTLVWLDDELEELWTAPARTPAFRRGDLPLPERSRRDPAAAAQAEPGAAGPASADARAAAGSLVEVLEAVAGALHGAEGELGELDSVAGDGDHGRGMTTGADAALAAAREAAGAGAGLSSALAAAGDAWADRAGGTSGALWGNGLVAAAGALSDDAAPDAAAGTAAVVAARDLVTRFGRAQRGDKTLVDALEPFVEALAGAGGEPFAAAWRRAADAAEEAARATADLRPRLGRARPLAERSVGHPDPGAVSLALVLRTAGAALG